MAHSAKSGPREGCERGFPSEGEEGFWSYVCRANITQPTHKLADLRPPHAKKKREEKLKQQHDDRQKINIFRINLHVCVYLEIGCFYSAKFEN